MGKEVLPSNMRVLRWVGSKWNMADKIIETFPKHSVYVEPFFGSGAVFFNRKVSEHEIINDLDKEVYNLFKVIRDEPIELAKSLEATPYAIDEYLEAMEKDNRAGLSSVEKARRFVIRSNMAIGSENERKTGWRTNGYLMSVKNPLRITNEWNQLPVKVLMASDRLKYAEIHNCDAIELLKKYNHEDVLAYVDPPYILRTRKRKYYSLEYTDEHHIKLLDYLVNEFKGKVVLSGYDDNIYNDRLKSWYRVEIDAVAETGGKRVEVIWFNYPPYGQTKLDI